MNDDLFTLTPDQKRAYDGLYNAPGYPARPCKDEPMKWDNRGPAAAQAAITACRACPALTECLTMARSGVQLDGVVAGEIHGGPESRPAAHPPELVAQALELYNAGYGAAAVARDLDINRETVTVWAQNAGVHRPRAEAS